MKLLEIKYVSQAMLHRVCQECGSDNTTKDFYVQLYRFYSVDNIHVTVKCSRCNEGQLDSRPGEDGFTVTKVIWPAFHQVRS